MRKRNNKRDMKKSDRRKTRWGRIFLSFLLSVMILYLLYFLIIIFSIKTSDIIKESNSCNHILSGEINRLDKTLIILEKGKGEERKIVDVYVYLSNSDKKNELLIYIPSSLYYAGLEEKFGNEIPVSSFRYAGDFLENGRGVEYAIWQINQLLGFKSEKYIYFSGEALEALGLDISSPNRENIVALNKKMGFFEFVKNLKEISKLDGTIYSNIRFSDIKLKVQNIVRTPNNYNREELNLGDAFFHNKGKLVTGEEINVLNTIAFDQKLRGFLEKITDRELENERVRVEVYNGSELVGAASGLGRKIVNTCCDVVRYGNAPDLIDKTKIYISDLEKYPKSYQAVSEVFPTKYELVEGRPDFMTTGDIIIILGNDIRDMYIF